MAAPYCMKASSSLLDAFVGGVFDFSESPPRVANHEPPKVVPSVAIASCGRSLVDLGLGVLLSRPYVMSADLSAEDIVHNHHLVEGLSQMRVASRTVGRVGYGNW
jgi:hypothetical protein